MDQTFYDVNGYSSLTAADLDRIALEEAGQLGSYGYGYACPVSTEAIPGAPDWGTMVIGTRGMGNHGLIVLKGLTPRTRALLRQGKAALLVRQGVPPDVAEVAASAGYGMEVPVALLASDLVAVAMKAPFTGRSHRSFAMWVNGWGVEIPPLSFPRKSAAAGIAAEVARRRREKLNNSEPVNEIGNLGQALLNAGVRL